VYSQWGEDGIIQYLLRHVQVEHKVFVEFGVENYLESNTRFLIQNNAWSGLVIDGSSANIAYIRRDPISWATHLEAIDCFITRENINEVLSGNGVSGDIGILGTLNNHVLERNRRFEITENRAAGIRRRDFEIGR